MNKNTQRRQKAIRAAIRKSELPGFAGYKAKKNPFPVVNWRKPTRYGRTYTRSK